MEYPALQSCIREFHYTEACGGLSFYALEVGPLCNAMGSVSFSDASCDLSEINPDGIGTLRFLMKSLFRPGFALLEGIGRSRATEETQILALNKLEKYLTETDEQGEKLLKVLLNSPAERRKEHITKTDISMALSEHLFGKLACGQPYLDISLRKRGSCKCGCGAKILFDYTGMGHEKVWHGFTDIVITAVDRNEAECPVVVTEDVDARASSLSGGSVTSVKKRKISYAEDRDEEEGTDDGSPSGKDSLRGAEDLAVSQAIVFSFIQRSRHLEYSNHLIPTIAISPSSFNIIIYDSENDILVCSNECQLFEGKKLSVPSVIILWLVLNYKLFCCGIDVTKIRTNIDYKSKFVEHVGECLTIYREKLKCNVEEFPCLRKKFTFPGPAGLGPILC